MHCAPALLEVLPLGPTDDAVVRWLAPRLARALDTDVEIEPALALVPEWRTPAGCFDSNRVVDALVDRFEAGGTTPEERWTLALTEAELCAPGRPFVFGEATLGGCCAVVSLARLRPHETSLDPALLRERTLKEALHELGHVAGLAHCADPACVMAESSDVVEIDRKGAAFCPACRAACAARRRGS